MSEETGKRIGDYEILAVLGSGGMGKVFKVRNVISDRIEAMKILLPDLAGRQDLADRFLREIKVLAALNHPNIAALRTALTLDNQLVMVMEYVEGITLATRLQAGAIPIADALNYIDQVLSALSYAHKQNVIHRDIKPANMMLTPQGVVKLMDFGIARSGNEPGLTKTGTTMGSLYYMSPEQVKGQTTDARSDLYSVGVSLYEMITGARPFQADSDFSLMAAQVQQAPKPPIELRSDVPAALNEIILLAIAKEPAQRFQSADAFRNALNSVRGTLPAVSGVTRTATAIVAPAVAAPPPQTATPAASIHDLPTATMQTPTPPPPHVQPAPSVAQLSVKPSGHRGLYMTLGALLVLVVLVAAGIYIPRRNKTGASEQSNTTQQQTPTATPDAANPASSDANSQTNPAAPQAETTNPAANSTPEATPPAPPSNTTDAAANEMGAQPAASAPSSPVVNAGKRTRASSGQSTQQSPADQAGADAAAQAQAANAAQLDELEQQVDQLSGRASAVNNSLDTLQRQQSAQGYGLRGDIVSTQEMMKTHLAKAQQALQNQDAKNAKKYSDMAEAELATLEHFLGR